MSATERHKPITPEGQFAKALRDLVEERRRPRPFVIPVLTADPPTTDPTNLWMRYDGRLRGRYWNGSGYTYVDYPMRSDITSPPAVPAYPAAPAPAATPTTYTATYNAVWSQGYLSSGSQRSSTTELPYGNDGNAAYGTQRSLIGFDYATIAATLAGSTVKRVQLHLINLTSWSPGGVTMYYSVHNVPSAPTLWPDASLPYRFVTSAHWARSEAKTIDLPIVFGTSFRESTGKGIAIEAPSNANTFYGMASHLSLQLIITYAK